MGSRKVWAATLGAFALVTACSGEDSDSFGSRELDASIGHGDASEPTPDAGADDAATEDPSDASPVAVDASEPGDDAGAEPGGDAGGLDAQVPTRSNFVVLTPDPVLARCGTQAIDVTWEGEPSLPDLTVSGLPEAITYEVSAQGDGAARVTLHAQNGVTLGAAHPLTLSLGTGVQALEAQASLSIASTFRVTVRVLDRSGEPIQGAQVTRDGNVAGDALLTDDSGLLTIDGVSGPYDLFVSKGDEDAAIEYHELTRCDPTIVGVGSEGGPSASVAGTITAPSGQTFDTAGDVLLVGAAGLEPASVQRASDEAASAFAFSPRWTGARTVTRSMAALWMRPGPAYLGAGVSSEVTLSPDMDIPSVAIALAAPVPTRSHTIVVNRAGYPSNSHLSLLSVGVGAARIDALDPNEVPSLGLLTFGPEETATLDTTLPASDTVLLASSQRSQDSSNGFLALLAVPAAAGDSTDIQFPASAAFEDVRVTPDDAVEGLLTFSWDPVPGADAIVVDLGSSVHAVLPGTATSYSTSTLLARTGVVPDTCTHGTWYVAAVTREGYDADADADGSGRKVPREVWELSQGAGHLSGARSARVLSWWHNTCH